MRTLHALQRKCVVLQRRDAFLAFEGGFLLNFFFFFFFFFGEQWECR